MLYNCMWLKVPLLITLISECLCCQDGQGWHLQGLLHTGVYHVPSQERQPRSRTLRQTGWSKYVLVISDHFTKFTESLSIKP